MKLFLIDTKTSFPKVVVHDVIPETKIIFSSPKVESHLFREYSMKIVGLDFVTLPGYVYI